MLLVTLVLAVSSASAQVTYDNNAVTGSINNNATLTVSNLNVPVANKALVIVAIRNSNSLAPTSVTYNAQALTLLQTSSSGTSRHHIYYRVMGDLAAPVTANVAITMGSVPVIQSAVAFSLKNVDQTTPMTNPGSVTFAATATSSSTTVAGLSGDMALDFIGAAGNSSGQSPTLGANAGQTEIVNIHAVNGNAFGVRFAASCKQQTVSPATMAWTVSFPTNSTGQGIQSIANVRSANKIYTTAANGNWDTAATWTAGIIPAATLSTGDKIQVNHTVLQNVDYTLAANTSLEIGSSGTLTVDGTRTLANNGEIKNAGTLTNNGTVSDAGVTTFNGTSAQTVGGTAAPSFNQLVINNAAGVTFNTNAAVGDILTLTSGNVTMGGSNVLTLGVLCSVSRTSGHVIGTMKKEYAGIGNFTYPVGTASGYTPVTAVVDTLGGGDFTVRSNDGFLAGTNAAQSVQRNWDLEATGLNHVDLTLTYLDADVPAGANESAFKFLRRIGTVNAQTAPSSQDTAANTATLNGITVFSKWGLGNNLAPTAASVQVSGRVTVEDGRGLVNAIVIMTDPNGTTRLVRTSSFGYYRFDGVEAGGTYVVSVSSKRYRFMPRAVTVVAELTDLDFTLRF